MSDNAAEHKYSSISFTHSSYQHKAWVRKSPQVSPGPVLIDDDRQYREVPVCTEKGFAILPVNATQAVATLAVRIWFGSHA